MNNKMLALYGLKWNPFTPSVPTEALHVTTRLESFCWRVQQLAGEGGFDLGFDLGQVDLHRLVPGFSKCGSRTRPVWWGRSRRQAAFVVAWR